MQFRSAATDIVRTMSRHGPGWGLAALITINVGRIGLALVTSGVVFRLLGW